MNKLLLIDGNSLVYRAFYGSMHTKGGLLKNRANVPVNAILVFHNTLRRLIDKYQPTHMLVAFDAGKSTFRHAIFQDYKANRHPMPEDLFVQLPLIDEMLSLMGIKTCKIPQIEADDILATLASQFDGQRLVFSSDRDLLQVVKPQVAVLLPKNNQQDELVITNENFRANYEIAPDQFIDFKALIGDSSDNLPGVKGIGPKGAITLLNKFGTITNIYQHLDELGSGLQEKLIKGKHDALLTKQMVTLKYDVPIPWSVADLSVNLQISQDLLAFFRKNELFSLEKKYQTSPSFDKIIL